MRMIQTAAALAAAVLFSGCNNSIYTEPEQEYLEFVKDSVSAPDAELLDRGYMYCSMLDYGIYEPPTPGDETVIRYAATQYLCPEHR